MENAIVLDNRPQLKDPIFIEGLPGVGNVGKIAADFMKSKLNAKKFGEVYSKHFPPQVVLDDNSVAALVHNELWHCEVNGKDIIMLLGDFQSTTPEGQFEIASQIMNLLMEMKVSKIITLGGYGTGVLVDEPRVLGAVAFLDMVPELKEHGVIFSKGEPAGGIVGASALFLGLGRLNAIDSVCLMGETSGYFLDHKSAVAMLKVLQRIVGFEVDMTELMEMSKQLDTLSEKVKEYEQSQSDKNLGYFG